MDLDIIKNEILKTGYLNNPKIGMILPNKYPFLFEKINNITSSLNDSLLINRTLRSRFIFLFKYNLDINKIKKNGKWLTFNRKNDDFIDKTDDYRKKSWLNLKENIPNEFYSKENTIRILKNDNFFKNYLGKAKNRTLLKKNPKLYGSIYKHTSFMDVFNKNNNKFSCRIIFLVKYNGDVEKLKCEKCKNKNTSFNYELMGFSKLCFNCFHINNKYKYPQRDWFKEKYGDDWLNVFNNFLVKNSIKFSKNSFSKISQKIFWCIYEKLTIDEKRNCFFKELNQEWYLNSNTNFYFVDFKYKNKIIEFDGVYWHKYTKLKDNERNSQYMKLGYDLLIINENDLIDKKNKIGNELIEKCISFLRDES